MQKNELISKIKRAVGGLSEAEIEGVLYELLFGGAMSNNFLVQKTGIPKESLKKLKHQIAEFLEKSNADLISLNEKGLKLFGEMGPNRYMWSLGDLVEIDPDKLKIFKTIRLDYQKAASRELDQFYATPETSLRKAAIMMGRGEVDGKDVAFLGDDDLVSLALIILGAKFRSVSVFDVDKTLLAFIEGKSKEMGNHNVHIYYYDCRDEIKKEHANRFDVVQTDPPYTRYGVELFLNRSLELLKSGAGRSIFFFYGNSQLSSEKFLKIQEIFNRCGLLIEDKVNKFARYDGAESIGSASSLYILKTQQSTSHTNLLPANRKIYTYETEKEEKFPFVDHVVLKVFHVSPALLQVKKRMMGVLNEFCRQHKLKVVDTKITEFKGSGFTFVYVLSNSNLTVHTWPEYEAVHFDLVTCSPIYNKAVIASTVSALFSTDSIEINFVE
ncbi:MAG: hypothetical protein KatS3mg101_0561 [Patescibacteria group bacterium]|nr:MAG: hypothetical protein KatS3mg101_0561 [Patescibacteria group bacterium]